MSSSSPSPPPLTSPPPLFTSLLFSTASLTDTPSTLLTPDYDLTPLFQSLLSSLKDDSLSWDVLLALKSVLRQTEKRGADTNTSAPSNPTPLPDDEDEDEDDDLPLPPISTTASPIDDALLASLRPDPSDPIAGLPPGQSKAFKALAGVIREGLSYLPSGPPQPQSGIVEGGEGGGSGVGLTPPIAQPRDGDIIGLFLLSLLISSPTKPFAQSTLLLLEALGSLASLRLTTRRLLELCMRPCIIQPPPNLLHTPLEGVDLTPGSKETFLTPHLNPSSFLPPLLQPGDPTDGIQRWGLRPLILRLLQSVLTEAQAAVSPLTSVSPSPPVWYQFTDTPIFPKVSRLALPPGPPPLTPPPSIHTHGYTWMTHLSLTAVRDAPNNVFRFFNDVGFGLQVAVKTSALCVRLLPPTTDAILLKGLELEEGRWVHVAVSHKPMPKAVQTAAAAQQLRRGLGGGAFPTPSPHGPHTGVFVAPSLPSPSTVPYSAMSSPHSPSSPHPHSRPGKLSLYVNGQLASTTDIPYPNLENASDLQCTLGGLYGRMGNFFLFADVLAPPVIAALYALGAGHYSIPAMHVVNAGLVAVFPPPPSATSAVPAPQPGTPGPVPASTSRTVARCLLAQSPVQTTHSVCLPYTWPDDAPPPASGPLTTPPTSSINQCLHHTLRLDGITVVYRTQNAQTLAVIGGLKLLILCTSPSYQGVVFTSDEDISDVLLLIASLILTNESHAHLLLEIGAVTIKQVYLDHVKKRWRTVRLLSAIRRLLLSIQLIDHSADTYHFASFTSALLLDFAFWGKATLPTQAAVIRLLRLLWDATPTAFLTFASLGVPRLMDNLLVLNSRFIVPLILPSVKPHLPSALPLDLPLQRRTSLAGPLMRIPHPP